MMKWLHLFAVVATLLGVTEGWKYRGSRCDATTCPSPPVRDTFDITRYTGVWWEYQRFPAFQMTTVCSFANYTQVSDTEISVVNAGIELITVDGVTTRVPAGIMGSAIVLDPEEPAKLQVNFGEPRIEGVPNYLVVDTDYDNFAVVYSCVEIQGNIVEMAFIITRKRGERPRNLRQINRKLKKACINPRTFVLVDQSNCEN